jgi:hypothetical protein
MTALRHDEAAILLPAVAAEVARDLGVRFLLIKGAVPAMHGLRTPRRSADVDVLIDPLGYGRFTERLGDLGWFEPTAGMPSLVSAPPARSFRHYLWPVELDIHRSFPGFLADPVLAFEALWQDRSPVICGDLPVDGVGWAGSVLIGALHALRTPGGSRGPEMTELGAAVSAAPAAKLAKLALLAEQTGATATATPLLEVAGIPVGHVTHDQQAAHAEWLLVTTPSPLVGVAWLNELRTSPWWAWPMRVIRALLGKEWGLRARYPAAPPGQRGLWLARWWRLRETIPHLPEAVRRVRLLR